MTTCHQDSEKSNSMLKQNLLKTRLKRAVITRPFGIIVNNLPRISIVSFIQKELSKKSYPQISHVKNIIQKSYPKNILSKDLHD